MSILPRGTVTFLFTDIEGSTRLWEAHPDMMGAALARHDALLQEAIHSHAGHVFKAVGDAFHAVFADAVDALAAAQAAQRALRAEAWQLPGGLRVRMALHTGTAEVREGDYFGPTLNRVARLLAGGHGGQVLLSDATRALVEPDLPAPAGLRDLGLHRLQDLSHPQRIFQLIAPDLPSDFPPLRTLDTLPNNLPRPLTSFIGREREIAEIKGLLSTARLVTLTGPGGSGKTRLAVQVAAELLSRFPDGVWLVELAALRDSSLVPHALASTVRVRQEMGAPLLTTLADALRPRHLLVVLDNCEHLLSACAHLAHPLLSRCPHLRILATSQQGLGIAGEVSYRVPSLSLPDPGQLPDLAELEQFEAVRLFVDRALLSSPRFALTRENASAVAQVCSRLDGIPLAVELAAARVKGMPVQEIASRLDDRFRLLTRGDPTALPRHQTLRAALEWSDDLLSEEERTLLRRLSVFAGGFVIEGVEAVCAGSGVEPPDVVDLLTRLVDRSLVQFDEQSGRYRLLETVRLYALERLQQWEKTRRRHRDWFLRLAEMAEPELQGPQQAVWLSRLEVERDNLRAALESSRAEDVEAFLRLAGTLWFFWQVRGYWQEGREWLEGAVSASSGLTTHLRVKVLNGAAYLAFFQGDTARTETLGQESLALARQLGDRRGTASCLNVLGLAACRIEKYGRAKTLGEESLALSREAGDRLGVAAALAVLGFVARGERDYARAWAMLEESAGLFRALGDGLSTALVLSNLGLVARDQGRYHEASKILEDTLKQFQDLRDRFGIAFTLNNLAIVAWNQGDHLAAEAFFKESLRLRRQLEEKRGIATCLVGLAAIAGARSEPQRAATLFGAAEVLRESRGMPLPPFLREDYERCVADVRGALDEHTFRTTWAQGRAMTLEQAVDYALR
ncbi:MAG: tetratricopeptide repeat protein [Armatimonadetes bacterium]|nr:tetratricopeptide repeat protein [Armatimonadota bacterium]